MRLETVVPIAKVEAVVRALRQSHPYEEPAFDLNQLAAPPEGTGHRAGRDAGRSRWSAGSCSSGSSGTWRSTTCWSRARPKGPSGGRRSAPAPAATCSTPAIARKAELYLTGEMRHHDALKAAGAGVTVVCTLHSNSERATLKRLKARLEQALPGLAVTLSRSDRDPFSVR